MGNNISILRITLLSIILLSGVGFAFDFDNSQTVIDDSIQEFTYGFVQFASATSVTAGDLYGTQPGGSPLLLNIDTNTSTGGSATTLPLGAGFAPPPSLGVDDATGLLYGGQGGGGPNIYEVDPHTGDVTLIGPTGLGFAAVAGMDMSPFGVMYAAVNIAGDGGTGADHLATINLSTGSATLIGPFGSCEGVPALPVDGSGICTIEGMEGIAFDTITNTLWGSHSARGAAGAAGLYTIDTTTGAATFVTALADGPEETDTPPSGGVVSLEFANDGTLFGGTARAISPGTDGGNLIIIDKSTGLYTTPTGNPTTTGSSLAALAIQNVFDTTPPTVTLSSTEPSPTNASPIPVTATFSEDVTGFVLGDISVGGGFANNFAGSGSVYTFDVIPTSAGAVTVNVAASVAN